MAKRIDALPTRIGLTFITDGKSLKIFTSVHHISVFYYSAKVVTVHKICNMSVLDAYVQD